MRDRWIAQLASAATRLDQEVAVADRVERVARSAPSKPSARGGRLAIERRRWCRRARPSRAATRFMRRARVEQPAAVALEHLAPREQVMRQAHRLRALQVRVAGHQQRRCCCSARTHSTHSSAIDARARWRWHASRVQSRMSVATWSLRLRPVCRRPPASPMRSVSAPRCSCGRLRCAASHAKLPALRSRRRSASRPATIVVASLGAEDAARAEHARVRDRAADVLEREALVDVDAGAERQRRAHRGLLRTDRPSSCRS